jgi:tetratricopeptide (TPR) repeat protein
MAKKNTTSIQPKTPVVTDSKKSNPEFVIRIFLAVLVLILYGQSINFEFTLDDDLFYLKHSSVQQGISGFQEFFSYGSLNKFDGTEGLQPYRPITLFVFAIQKTLFDNSPVMAHLMNVLLYILCIHILFSLIKKLFPTLNTYLICLVCILFATHPIHTEVVASVKSMDELLAAIFAFLSWKFLLPKDENTKLKPIDFAVGLFLFMLALLSKESAIAFLVIIPLANYMLMKKELKSTLYLFVSMAIVAGIFLLIRHQVLGSSTSAISDSQELENVLNATKSFGENTATKAVILFYYIKLLFVPWPLNWDYSFNQIPVANWGSLMSWLGLIIYAGLFVFAILKFKKHPILSFSIFFFFITSSPTNNLFITNGATVGERFLFVPSFGFALGIVFLLNYLLNIDIQEFSGKFKNIFIGIFAILLIAFSGLTMARVGDWKNNLSLFEKGVENAPNSSRTQYSLATEYLNRGEQLTDTAERNELLRKSLFHFTKSLEIYPKNKLSHYNSSKCHAFLGDTISAMIHYRKAIELDKKYIMPYNNLGVIFHARNEFDSAQYYYEKVLEIAPNEKTPVKNLGDLFLMKGIFLNNNGFPDAAIASYKKSMTYQSTNNVLIFNNMASIYSSLKKYDSALIYFEKGYEINPKDVMIIQNIAVVAYLTKNYLKAIEYANKALSINNNLKKSFGILADTYTAIGNSKEAQRFRTMFDNAK